MKENTFFDYQKANFDSVWGSLTSGSISDEERLLFEQPSAENKDSELWQDLEFLQPSSSYFEFLQGLSMENNSTNECTGNKSLGLLDQRFGKDLTCKDEEVKNDPMLSSSLDISTPQHPFEEKLALSDNSTNDINRKGSLSCTLYHTSLYTIYEDADDNQLLTSKNNEHKENYNLLTINYNGYPISIHSWCDHQSHTRVNK